MKRRVFTQTTFTCLLRTEDGKKMPHFCAAYGCSNRGGVKSRSRGITFHSFPKRSDLRRRWVAAVRRRDFVPAKSTKLCSNHFTLEDFDVTGQTVRLRPGVVPSLFNFPSSSKVEEVKPSTKRAVIKVEDGPPQPDPPRRTPQIVPKEHSYALPPSPDALKARLNQALDRVMVLERKKHNSLIRERRAKRTVLVLLEYLREKNLINEELKDTLGRGGSGTSLHLPIISWVSSGV